MPKSLQYSPGDVLMLVPQNSEKNVQLLFDIINKERSGSEVIDPNTLVRVSEKDGDLPVPETLRHPIRLLECAKKYWDLNVSLLSIIVGFGILSRMNELILIVSNN